MSPPADGGVAGDGSGGTGEGPVAEGDGFYRMEALDRGVVAVQVSGGVFVSFRVLGTEYDPSATEAVSYELLRDDTLVTTLAGAHYTHDSACGRDAL